jgi:hypothetical protein
MPHTLSPPLGPHGSDRSSSCFVEPRPPLPPLHAHRPRQLPPKSAETAATNPWVLIHLGHMTCRLPVTRGPSCISTKKKKGLHLWSERREKREIGRRPNSPYRRHYFRVASSRSFARLVGRCSRPRLVGLCTRIGEFLTGATQSPWIRSSPHAIIAT